MGLSTKSCFQRNNYCSLSKPNDSDLPHPSSYSFKYLYPFHCLLRFCCSLWKALISSLIIPTYGNLFMVYILPVHEEYKHHGGKTCLSGLVNFSLILRNLSLMFRIQHYLDRTVRIKNVYWCPACILT